MEKPVFKFSEPKRKRNAPRFTESPFPVPIESIDGSAASNQHWNYFMGYLIGNSIHITSASDMKLIYEKGFFGKGNLSWSGPEYNTKSQSNHEHMVKKRLRIMARRRYLKHAHWHQLASGSASLDEVVEDGRIPYARKVKDLTITAASVEQPGSVIVDAIVDLREEMPGSPNCFSIAGAKSKDTKALWLTSTAEETEAFWGSALENVGESFAGGNRQTEPLHIASTSVTNAFAFQNDDIFEWSHVSSEWLASDTVICDDRRPRSPSDSPISIDTVSRVAQESEETALNECNADMDTFVTTESDMQDGKTVEFVTSVTVNRECCLKEDSDGGHVVVDNLDDTALNECNADMDTFFTTESDMQDDKTVEFVSSVTVNRECCEIDERSSEEDSDGDLVVVNDTEDSDIEDVSLSLRPAWQPITKKDPFPLNEHLQLSLEEAFFLSYGLGCLVVLDETKAAMNLTDMWTKFCHINPKFVERYVAYHNFRSKGWIPKPGLKFGADFILYKQGPPFFHASYSVIVKTVQADSLRPGSANDPLQSWTSLSCLNRITEQVSKELMICYVIQPVSLTASDRLSPLCIRRFKVMEVVVRRWISKKERDNADFLIVP